MPSHAVMPFINESSFIFRLTDFAFLRGGCCVCTVGIQCISQNCQKNAKLQHLLNMLKRSHIILFLISFYTDKGSFQWHQVQIGASLCCLHLVCFQILSYTLSIQGSFVLKYYFQKQLMVSGIFLIIPSPLFCEIFLILDFSCLETIQSITAKIVNNCDKQVFKSHSCHQSSVFERHMESFPSTQQ